MRTATMRSRCAVTGAALLLGVATPATAGELQNRTPASIFAHPVATDRSVIAVDAGSRDDLRFVVVRDRSGAEVAKATLTDGGQALLPVTMKAGSRKKVSVTLTDTAQEGDPEIIRPMSLTTEAAALRDSVWRVVNKSAGLRPTDKPRTLKTVEGVQLDPRAARGFARLMARADEQRTTGWRISNGYRAYGWQQGLYQSYARRDGKAEADRFSARPGHSEHQTGLAFDAKATNGRCDLQECFGSTPEGRFLRTYAPEAGFVVRYTKANQAVTGYNPEPWHLRYVGIWLTDYLHETRTTSLEDAFGMPAATSYDS